MPAESITKCVEIACREQSGLAMCRDFYGNDVTFGNFFFANAAFAERLANEGVQKGELVVIGVRDWLSSLLLSLAAMRIGANAFPVSALPFRIDFGVTPDWIVADGGSAGGSGRILEFTSDWIRDPSEIALPSLDGGLIISSSGTTGKPKLRIHSQSSLHARVLNNAKNRPVPRGAIFVGYGQASSPGMKTALRAILEGRRQIRARATEEETLSEMARDGAVAAFTAPLVFERLVKAAAGRKTSNLSLKAFFVGGGQISPALAAWAEALFGCPVFNTYGSSETGHISHHRPALTPEESGIVGCPYSGIDLKISPMDHDQINPIDGEILVKVAKDTCVREFPSLAPIGDADGWIRTGDVGRLSASGLVKLSGRISDLINVGGNKFSPLAVEDIARRADGVSDVLAFRAPLASGSDSIGLAIVPGVDFQLEAFCSHMTDRLGQMYPFHVTILDGLPKTPAGKADRAYLTREFQKCQIAAS